MIVLDNSVVVDLLLARIQPEQVGDGPFAAPELLDAEFVQVLRRLNRSGVLNDGQSRRLLSNFAGLRIDRHPMQALRSRALELRHNLTAYDAMYVALAEVLDAKLLTTNTRIGRAPGTRCPVEVL